MRVVFMGTPAFAADVFDSLIASSHDVVAVFTRPDAVRSRGKKLVASPVKERALAAGIEVHEWASLKSDEAYAALEALSPDVVCVAAYGAILPKRVLDLPRFGCLNVHGSLLPRWRGAAPIERAILAGDDRTGIGIMKMETGLDTGDTCETRVVDIADKSADELTVELAKVGGEALVCALDKLDSDAGLDWTPQPEEGVTYAEKIAKGELDVHPALDVVTCLRRVRASGESHACRTSIAGKSLTLLSVCAAVDMTMPSGSVTFERKRLFLGCADGVLEVLEVKPDGKKPMEAKAFAAGIQGIKQGSIEWQGLN